MGLGLPSRGQDGQPVVSMSGISERVPRILSEHLTEGYLDKRLFSARHRGVLFWGILCASDSERERDLEGD